MSVTPDQRDEWRRLRFTPANISRVGCEATFTRHVVRDWRRADEWDEIVKKMIAARSAVPALLDENDALRAKLAAAETLLADLQKSHNQTGGKE